MAILIPPPPTGAPQGDRVWTDWYIRLSQILSSTAGIAWALVDKTGSALSDIASRPHSALTSILGTGSNHISNSEATTVSNIQASGHQGLTNINGTGNYHHTSAEGTTLTNINTSGHQGLTSINGTGNYHHTSAEGTTLTNINTSGHAGLTSILGSGDRHITSAENTTVTSLNTDKVFPLKSGSADPTTSDIAASQCAVYKNTTSGEVRVWTNDGGTMKKSAAFT